jgi:hypothetical protein
MLPGGGATALPGDPWYDVEREIREAEVALLWRAALLYRNNVGDEELPWHHKLSDRGGQS